MTIATNRRAYHDYFIEDRFEAGLALQGWEVKAIREGRVQLKDSYIKIKDYEVWLLGCHISPLISTSTHIFADNVRIKKLLLNKKEIDKLDGRVSQKGYSILALNLHFKKGKVKVEIALAKGKKMYDKRQAERDREAKLEKAKALKEYNTR